MKISLLLCLLFISSAAAAQQKRRVKTATATDSLSRHTIQLFFDSTGRQTSIKFKDHEIVSIVTYTHTGKEKSRELIDDHNYHQVATSYYDKNDNLISTKTYDMVDDSKYERVSCTYDEKNREITRSYYHPSGELEQRVCKSYDDNSNTDTTWWYSGPILKQSISKYDNHKKEIAREVRSGDDTIKYTIFIYDKQNRLIEEKMQQGRYYENTTHQYYPNGDPFKTHTDEWTHDSGKVVYDSEHINEYDADGNKTKSTYVWKKNGRVFEKTIMRYSYEYY